MDFDIFKTQVIIEYLNLYGNDRPGDDWSLGNCLRVFQYYFKKYRRIMGEDHPNMSNKTIRKIIQAFPYLEGEEYGRDEYVEPADYPPMINKYFEQDFEDCNYSIAHFMSGKIRQLRFYEELY